MADGIIKTLAQAKRYAESMSKLHNGEKWLTFKIPHGSPAYGMGMRFHACKETERSVYEAGGAEFVD
jgi:hypothetical protein